jgi:hypothetical protein
MDSRLDMLGGKDRHEIGYMLATPGRCRTGTAVSSREADNLPVMIKEWGKWTAGQSCESRNGARATGREKEMMPTSEKLWDE